MYLELRLVWFEKIKMLYKSSIIYKSNWYVWIDSGINTYRLYNPPTEWWPAISLDRFDKKFVVHNFNGKYAFAATAFAIHESIINEIYDLFYYNYHQCKRSSKSTDCDDEQKLFEIMYNKYPSLFTLFKTNTLNWGALVTQSYTEKHKFEAAGCKIYNYNIDRIEGNFQYC